MVDLNKFASEGKSWIKLDDGASFTGKYVNLSEGIYETGRAKGKKYISYHFDMDGEEKTLSASSQRLAGRMASVPFGCVLTIKAFGAGTEKVYEVEVESNPHKDKVDDLSEEAVPQEPMAVKGKEPKTPGCDWDE